MPTIVVETVIDVPIGVCFDAARDIGLHCQTMAYTKERAVAGVTGGLIGAGQSVTFEAVHFGIRQRLSATVVRFDPPRGFADEMTQGAFAALTHTHEFFMQSDTQTLMCDTLEWRSPLGPLGLLADALFLKRYMTDLIRGRGVRLKHHLETLPQK